MTETLPIDPSEVPLHPYERRGWIATKLALLGLNQGKLADRIGCSRQTLGKCLIGPVSERIDISIAKALGLTPQQLFPERYAADGSRLHRVMPISEAAKAA